MPSSVMSPQAVPAADPPRRHRRLPARCGYPHRPHFYNTEQEIDRDEHHGGDHFVTWRNLEDYSKVDNSVLQPAVCLRPRFRRRVRRTRVGLVLQTTCDEHLQTVVRLTPRGYLAPARHCKGTLRWRLCNGHNLTLPPQAWRCSRCWSSRPAFFEVLHLWLDPAVISRRVTSRRWKSRSGRGSIEGPADGRSPRRVIRVRSASFRWEIEEVVGCLVASQRVATQKTSSPPGDD